MPKIDLKITNGFYESSSKPFSSQRCVNMYPQVAQAPGAINGQALFFTPGVSLFAQAGESDIGRGAIKFNGEFYTVQGQSFNKISSSGKIEFLGTVEGTGRVEMAHNGLAIAIVVPGVTSYFYDPTISFYEIADPDFQDFKRQEGGVISVVSLGGYFVFCTPFEFFLSSLVVDGRGQKFGALDYATAEIKPDKNVKLAVLKNELYVLGEESIEVFRNVGGSGFPFQRVNGAAIDKGLRSQFAFTVFQESIFFLGSYVNEGAAVWRAGPGVAQKISTPAVDQVIQSYPPEELDKAFAISYTEEGGYFVIFTFSDRSLVFDSAASQLLNRLVWHERKSGENSWRVSTITNVYNKLIVTDTLSGRTGVLDKINLEEYGENIERFFVSEYVSNSGDPFSIVNLKLQLENGVGLPEVREKGVDPMIKLEISDDGCRTFHEVGSMPLGRQNDWNRKVEWWQLGLVENSRAFKFSCSDPVRFNVFKATLEVN